MTTQIALPMSLPVQPMPGLVDRLGPCILSSDRRPGAHNRIVLQAAAEKILPDVLNWMDLPADTDQRDRILEQLIKVAEPHKDGYELARDLERKFLWATDSDLVDIMDELTGNISQAHKDLVRVWVREFKIAPSHKINDRVTIRTWVEDGKGKAAIQDVEGEVVRIDEKDATYLVCCEQLGHVRTGYGTHGFVIPFEQARDPQPLAA